MRPHGRASVSQTHPRAHAICERCGFTYNHDQLRWQMRWRGPRLQNIRILVCPSCYDTPNEVERTIILPIDPVTISNARPENYAVADNPLSGLGFNPRNMFVPVSSMGGNIGNMVNNGGVDAAFSMGVNKSIRFSAVLAVSNSSFQNFVGKNWNGDSTGVSLTLPSTTQPIAHNVSVIAIYAPNDQPFLTTGPTGWQFQGSNDGLNWTTFMSGKTAGTVGESISATSTAGAFFSYHRFVLQGDGVSIAAVAGVVINVSDAFQNEW